MKVDKLYRDDMEYVQSANTLFHFMKEERFLLDAIRRKRLAPRYCEENIEYLEIGYDRAYILQKCFCDIPLHKLMENFPICLDQEKSAELTSDELNKLQHNNTHTDYYGKYGIAFSKSWCKEHNLQPVHYLNERSSYTRELAEVFQFLMDQPTIADIIATDMLERLSYIKPLSGTMSRIIKDKRICLYKNFHDEKEWRFIPKMNALSKSKIGKVIVNPKLADSIFEISNNLEKEEYRGLWLEFAYEDIKYLIVPDNQTRINLINTIIKCPDNCFDAKLPVENQKYVLISKILVLDEIRKDW